MNTTLDRIQILKSFYNINKFMKTNEDYLHDFFCNFGCVRITEDKFRSFYIYDDIKVWILKVLEEKDAQHGEDLKAFSKDNLVIVDHLKDLYLNFSTDDGVERLMLRKDLFGEEILRILKAKDTLHKKEMTELVESVPAPICYSPGCIGCKNGVSRCHACVTSLINDRWKTEQINKLKA